MSFDYALPESWHWSTLDEVKAEGRSIVSGPFGSNIGKRFFVESGVPVIRGNNLSLGLGRFKDEGFVFLTEEKATEFRNCEAHPGDILFTAAGTIGQVGIIPPNGKHQKYIISNKQLRARLDSKKVAPLFAYYWFASPEMVSAIQSRNTGSTIPLINLSVIKSLRIPVPPLCEQTRIVEQLSLLDARITLLRETNTTLEAIAQALFKSWFVDFDPVRAKMEGRAPEGMDEATAALFPDGFDESELGIVPRGWRNGLVNELGDIVCGKTPATKEAANYGDEVPFITIPDMHGLLVVTSTQRSLSRLGADSQRKKYLPVGAICVSCIATPGLVVRVTTEAQTNQQINSVVPSASWGKSFPLFLLRRIGDAVRAGGSGGSVFHNLSKSGFEALSVLLPSHNLARRFDEVAEPLIAKIVENQCQVQALANLRDTLLPRLISGQLRLPEVEA